MTTYYGPGALPMEEYDFEIQELFGEAQYGNWGTVSWYLDRNYHVDTKNDRNGWTLLDYAYKQENLAAQTLLLETYGADQTESFFFQREQERQEQQRRARERKRFQLNSSRPLRFLSDDDRNGGIDTIYTASPDPIGTKPRTKQDPIGTGRKFR